MCGRGEIDQLLCSVTTETSPRVYLHIARECIGLNPIQLSNEHKTVSGLVEYVQSVSTECNHGPGGGSANSVWIQKDSLSRRGGERRTARNDTNQVVMMVREVGSLPSAR